MNSNKLILTLIFAFFCNTNSIHAEPSLRGSKASVVRQYSEAVAHDFTFLRTATEVRRFVRLGLLVKLAGKVNYRLHKVSYPYVRPEVRLFIERLSRQYRAACGEQLVITSATRPKNEQPWNASRRSVHPTGMAIDLRVSKRKSCRSWLEENLLVLEKRKVAEATRERNPPHYHVVVYPQQYACYVKVRTGQGTCSHTVAAGEILSAIALRYNTSVARIMAANETLSSPNLIRAGQQIIIK